VDAQQMPQDVFNRNDPRADPLRINGEINRPKRSLMRSFTASTMLIAGVLAIPQLAAAQTPTGNSPFCLKSSNGVSCAYQTMALCDQAKKGTDQCMTNAQANGTTGQGTPSTTPQSQPSPAPAPAPR